jgi:HipA-like C-terminal domain
MSKFPIYRVSGTKDRIAQDDVTGVVDKGWDDIPNLGRCLVKFGDDLSNEVWKEKIASELAASIGIPTATYEFGELADGQKAILSPSYLHKNWVERSGKLCLTDTNQNLYTIDNVLNTIDHRNLTLPDLILPSNVKSSSDLFTGYLLFDYLIANGDRHSKNWGIQIDPISGREELLPLYDCGFSMRFANSRNQGAEYLRWYTEDLETAFVSETNFPMQMRTIVKKLRQLKPDAVRAWRERIEAIEREFIVGLFARIPDGWIKESQIAPAIALIDFNRQPGGFS